MQHYCIVQAVLYFLSSARKRLLSPVKLSIRYAFYFVAFDRGRTRPASRPIKPKKNLAIFINRILHFRVGKFRGSYCNMCQQTLSFVYPLLFCLKQLKFSLFMIKNHIFFCSFEGWKIDINTMLVWDKWIGINAMGLCECLYKMLKRPTRE